MNTGKPMEPVRVRVRAGGRVELVEVARIEAGSYSNYALAVTDESPAGIAAELQLYLPERSPAWLESLDERSRRKLQNAGTLLNFSAFKLWWRRRARMLGLLPAAAGKGGEG